MLALQTDITHTGVQMYSAGKMSFPYVTYICQLYSQIAPCPKLSVATLIDNTS